MNKQEIRVLLEQAETDNSTLPILEEVSEEEHYSTTLAAWQDDQGWEFAESGDFEQAEKMFKMSINTYWHCYSEFLHPFTTHIIIWHNTTIFWEDTKMLSRLI